MFDLEGKDAAVTLAVYQKEMGKPYTQTLKDFITANAEKRACQENCVNGYVRISRLEPVCQIVWQIDLLLKPNF